MTLADVSNGPDWVMWVGFAIILIMSLVLISGHGAGLIAGYNTASKAEQDKYDAKKLSRVTGIGMAVIAVLIGVMGLLEDVLPASFAYVALVIIVMVCVAIIILGNTICKK
jgi:drug/metabolite transporter (DMT)-like permease